MVRETTPGIAIGVATGNNRTNSSGHAPVTPKSRTTITLSNIVQPGASLPLPVAGTEFYFSFTTSEVFVTPDNGVANPYTTGTGLQLDLSNAFSLLQITNRNAYAVVFQIVIGFDVFIDKRLILDTTTTPVVAFPTYPTPSSAAVVNITDKSGAPFTDINGGKWYAISREAFYIFNTDTGVTLLVQKSNTVIANGPSVAAVYPQTSLRLPWSGDYRLSVGGGNINAVVSEGYLSIPAT